MHSDVLTERAAALFDEYADAFYSVPREAGGPPGLPEEIEAVKQELLEMGWTFEGRGDARIVFGIPDSLTTTSQELVVKFPLQPVGNMNQWWRDGINQTETEVNMFYEAMVDTTYLALVRAFDETCKWVVMERVDEYDPEETELGVTTTLEHRIEGAALEPQDLHTGNLGWLPVDEDDPADPLIQDGRRLVMMDYGMLSTASSP